MNIPVKVKNPFGTLRFEGKVYDVNAKDVAKNVFDKLMEIMLYATCFFSFVSPIYLGTDTQPYAALWSIFVVLYFFLKEKIEVPRVLMVIICCSFVVCGLALMGINDMGVKRLLAGSFAYVTLIATPLATLLIMKKNGWNENYVKVIIWIWFIVGFIQKYIEPTFAYSILSRHSTTVGRGVVSLGTEPSAYGYMCIFMMIFAFNFKKDKYLYLLSLLIQIVLFARSSVTLLYLGAYLGMMIINELVLHKRFAFIKTAGLATVGIGAVAFLYTKLPRTNRIGKLLYFLFNDPEKLMDDASIKLRLEAITYSLQGFIENNGLPNGISETRIMSGLGGLCFESGFIGIIILVAIGVIIWKAYPVKTRFIFTAGFMVVMISSIPFTAPVVSFYIGYCLYQIWIKEQEKKSESIMDM